MITRKRFTQTILAILGGVATYFVSPLLLIPWVDLGWRRPIQEWMIAHGAGNLVGHFGLFYIQIPDYITAIIAGIVIGVVAWRRWWQLSLVYSGTVIVIPYVWMIFDGSISDILEYSIWNFSILLLFHTAVIPFVLASSYITSKKQRLRHVRQELQLCLHCGYNLTGNTSGTCPECGSQISKQSKNA